MIYPAGWVAESMCPSYQLHYTRKLCPGSSRAHATGDFSEYGGRLTASINLLSLVSTQGN